MHILKRYITILLLFFLSCSSEKESQDCCSGTLVMLGFDSFLLFEETDELNKIKDDIEKITKETIALVNEKMPIDNLTVKIEVSAIHVIPGIGIGGFNPNPNKILIYIDPNFTNLKQSFAEEFAPILAHEMHHAKRQRTIGYGTTLFEAVISEGLADCFSMEIMGTDPPIWSVALSENELDYWMDKASDVWNSDSYNHEDWFFGYGSEIPRWAGYAIGYELVKNFTDENPGTKPSYLYDAPATLFIPMN